MYEVFFWKKNLNVFSSVHPLASNLLESLIIFLREMDSNTAKFIKSQCSFSFRDIQNHMRREFVELNEGRRRRKKIMLVIFHSLSKKLLHVNLIKFCCGYNGNGH